MITILSEGRQSTEKTLVLHMADSDLGSILGTPDYIPEYDVRFLSSQ